jgi:hypothetical protein
MICFKQQTVRVYEQCSGVLQSNFYFYSNVTFLGENLNCFGTLWLFCKKVEYRSDDEYERI